MKSKKLESIAFFEQYKVKSEKCLKIIGGDSGGSCTESTQQGSCSDTLVETWDDDGHVTQCLTTACSPYTIKI